MPTTESKRGSRRRDLVDLAEAAQQEVITDDESPELGAGVYPEEPDGVPLSTEWRVRFGDSYKGPGPQGMAEARQQLRRTARRRDRGES